MSIRLESAPIDWMRLDRLRRLFATGLSFAVFGIGGLVIGATLFPLIHLASADRGAAQRHCQHVVHHAFRLFIWMMRCLGVLTFEVVGAVKLQDSENKIVVANHPSLLDVVFIISLLPHTLCVVKKKAWSNPAMCFVLWATGYIPNDDPQKLVDVCVDRLAQGHTLVVFPEGTRTLPGRSLDLKRGAASIIVKSGKGVIPIAVTCTPTTLSKKHKWYNIPETKPHFRLVVGDCIRFFTLVDGELPLAMARRRVNHALYQILAGGILRSEKTC